MLHKIHNSKFRFIIISLFIYFLAICSSIAFISFDYVKKNNQVKLANLGLATSLLTAQIKSDSNFTPQDVDSKYYVFVLDQKTGEYIFDRKFKGPNERALWYQYHKKLIYQMQKQKDGWIYYPNPSNRKITESTYALRFITIEEDGVIVAVETFIESNLNQIKEVLQTKTFLKLIAVLLLGFALLFSVTERNFATMRRTISDNLETSFMNMNNSSDFENPNYSNITTAQPSSNSMIFEKLKPMPEGENSPTTIIEDEIEDIDNTPSEIVKKPIKIKKEIAEPSVEEIPKQKEKIVKKPQKEIKIKQQEKKESPIDDLTIEIEGVKSPLLKKLIKDIRDE